MFCIYTTDFLVQTDCLRVGLALRKTVGYSPSTLTYKTDAHTYANIYNEPGSKGRKVCIYGLQAGKSTLDVYESVLNEACALATEV